MMHGYGAEFVVKRHQYRVASTWNFLGAGGPNGGLDSIKSMSSAAKLLQCKTQLQTTTLLNMLSFTAHLSPFSLSLSPNNKVQKNVVVAS